VKIRLAEIDAPEMAQAYGDTSKQSLSGMVLGKRVGIISQAVDQYGRLVAHLSEGEIDVNAEQVRRGLAWEYSSYHSNKAMIAIQEEAKQASRGLWALGNPTPPWIWRKLYPSTYKVADHTELPGASCGKLYCSEMSSCDEAIYYLTQCGVKSLDGNGDGTPCEQLCSPRIEIKN
jgi:micrococcal nuclease